MKIFSGPIAKKGILNNLTGLAVGIAALAIVLTVVFLIMSSTASNTTVTADANASAAIDKLQIATDAIPGWVPLVVITVIGVSLLGLVRLFRT